MAPVESPVDDGGGDTGGYTGEGHRLAPGNLDQLLGRGHHLGRHWGDRGGSEGSEGRRGEEGSPGARWGRGGGWACRGQRNPARARPASRPQVPAHCSRTRRCGRDNRSPRRSGSWRGCTCWWRRSGTVWARTPPRDAWQLGTEELVWAPGHGPQAAPRPLPTPTPSLLPPPGVPKVTMSSRPGELPSPGPATAATPWPTVSRPVGQSQICHQTAPYTPTSITASTTFPKMDLDPACQGPTAPLRLRWCGCRGLGAWSQCGDVDL